MRIQQTGPNVVELVIEEGDLLALIDVFGGITGEEGRVIGEAKPMPADLQLTWTHEHIYRAGYVAWAWVTPAGEPLYHGRPEFLNPGDQYTVIGRATEGVYPSGKLEAHTKEDKMPETAHEWLKRTQAEWPRDEQDQKRAEEGE